MAVSTHHDPDHRFIYHSKAERVDCTNLKNVSIRLDKEDITIYNVSSPRRGTRTQNYLETRRLKYIKFAIIPTSERA